jgi:hypothetical protein
MNDLTMNNESIESDLDTYGISQISYLVYRLNRYHVYPFTMMYFYVRAKHYSDKSFAKAISDLIFLIGHEAVVAGRSNMYQDLLMVSPI